MLIALFILWKPGRLQRQRKSDFQFSVFSFQFGPFQGAGIPATLGRLSVTQRKEILQFDFGSKNLKELG